MRLPNMLSLVLLLASVSLAQQTQTVTVIEKPGLTTTITRQRATSKPTSSPITSTSVAQPVYSRPANAVASGPAGVGAGGKSSAFELSSGGFIAIIVVVIAVVIFGIVSTVLFVIAKRRQWKIRESIKRASRRLTGRRHPRPRNIDERRQATPTAAQRKEKRADTTIAHPPGQKQGLAIEVKDIEKGRPDVSSPEKRKENWAQRLRGNQWT